MSMMKKLSLGIRGIVVAASCVMVAVVALLLIANVPAVEAGFDGLMRVLRVERDVSTGLSEAEAQYLRQMEDLFYEVAAEVRGYASPVSGIILWTSSMGSNEDLDQEGRPRQEIIAEDGSKTIVRFTFERKLFSIEEYDVEGNLVKTTQYQE
jgi:hypothetical protein